MRRTGMLFILLILLIGAGGYFYWGQIKPAVKPVLQPYADHSLLGPYIQMAGIEPEQQTQGPSQTQPGSGTQQQQQDQQQGPDIPPVEELHRSAVDGLQESFRTTLGLPDVSGDEFRSWLQGLAGVESTFRFDVAWDTGTVNEPLNHWKGSVELQRLAPEQWKINVALEEPSVLQHRNFELRRMGENIQLILPELNKGYTLPEPAANFVRNWLDSAEGLPNLVTESAEMEDWNDTDVVRLEYETGAFEPLGSGPTTFGIIVDPQSPSRPLAVTWENQDGDWTYELEYDGSSQRLTAIRTTGPQLTSVPPLNSPLPAELAGSQAQPALRPGDEFYGLLGTGDVELQFAYENEQLGEVSLITPEAEYRGTPTRADNQVTGLEIFGSDGSDIPRLAFRWDWPAEGLSEFRFEIPGNGGTGRTVAFEGIEWKSSIQQVEAPGDDIESMTAEEFLREFVGSAVVGLSHASENSTPELDQRVGWVISQFNRYASGEAISQFEAKFNDNQEVESALPSTISLSRLRVVREQLDLRIPLNEKSVVTNLLEQGAAIKPINSEEYDYVHQVVKNAPDRLQRRATIIGPQNSGETIYYNPNSNYPYSYAPKGFDKAKQAFESGDFQKTRKQLVQLKQRFPKSAHVNYTLGMVHFEQGEFGRAYYYFDRARRMTHDPQVASWGQHYFARVNDKFDSSPAEVYSRVTGNQQQDQATSEETEAVVGSDTGVSTDEPLPEPTEMDPDEPIGESPVETGSPDADDGGTTPAEEDPLVGDDEEDETEDSNEQQGQQDQQQDQQQQEEEEEEEEEERGTQVQRS